MSLPVLLPGSCCLTPGRTSSFTEPPHRTRARSLAASPRGSAGASRLLLPGRPLLSLGLLQLLLGGSMVALSFGALSLSNSAAVRTSCPFWAGSSVILSGIVGLTTWKKPLLLLVNVFVLLSVVCVLLNLAGFILCCQGAQLVSSTSSCQLSDAGDVCYCCSLSPASMCSQDKRLELHPAHSCNTMRVLLKKVLFALCALNALTTAVCLMAAALRYLQIFTSRSPCVEEPMASLENGGETSALPDPADFVAPTPPPSYFSTFYSYTPRLSFRNRGNNAIPLTHIYGTRLKGVEVFCPLEPPPPYEAMGRGLTPGHMDQQSVPPGDAELTPPRHCAEECVVSQQLQSPLVSASKRKSKLRRSKSDPVLLDLPDKVKSLSATPQTTDSSTQTSQPTLAPQAPHTLQCSTNRRGTHRRPRPASMVDYQSYQHTQHLVRKILDQPAARGLAPEVQELVDSIRTVLRCDQQHMDEAVRCASYLEQVFTNCASTSPKPCHRSHRRATVLHLSSCGDLSSYSWTGTWRAALGMTPCTQLPNRPHSLITTHRETEL